MNMRRYLHALRFAVDHQANAYRFTLVIRRTGGRAIWQLDPAMHLASAEAAAAAGWASTLPGSGIAEYFSAAFAASSVRQLLLTVEVAAPPAPRHRCRRQ
jgi:hypothetical protein